MPDVLALPDDELLDDDDEEDTNVTDLAAWAQKANQVLR